MKFSYFFFFRFDKVFVDLFSLFFLLSWKTEKIAYIFPLISSVMCALTDYMFQHVFETWNEVLA